MTFFPAAESPKDWPEDAKYENGGYVCRCFDCGHTFIGHKRRIACKECTKSFVKATTPEVTGD